MSMKTWTKEFVEDILKHLLVKLQNSVTIIDQAGQPKCITRATILEYNRNTVFGVRLDGKKLWLGKYDTVEEAEKVKNIINESLIEKKRCDLRYYEEFRVK